MSPNIDPTGAPKRNKGGACSPLQFTAQHRAAQGPHAEPAGAPLSSGQYGLWLLNQMEPSHAHYITCLPMQMRGALHVKALQRALQFVQQRHAILRTTFPDDLNPCQIVNPDLPLCWREVDLQSSSAAEQKTELESILQDESRRSFDLSQDSMMRTCLVKLGPEEHLFILCLHHIAADGWSVGVLYRELSNCYAAFSAGVEPRLPPLPLEYSDFSRWQHAALASSEFAPKLEYWKKQLAGLPVLDFPLDRARLETDRHQGAHHNFSLPAELVSQLKILCRRQHASPYMVLLTGFATLLSRYSQQTEFVIGTPAAAREHVELESLVGLFANMLVLRLDFKNDPTFNEALSHTRDVTLDAAARQDVPFETLVEALRPKRKFNQNPLFQVSFQIQNHPLQPLALPGLALQPIDWDNGTSKFDLTLNVEEKGERVSGWWEYNTDLFLPETIARMAQHYEVLLKGILAAPHEKISRLQLLIPYEHRQMLAQPIDEETATTPDKTALSCNAKECIPSEKFMPSFNAHTTIPIAAEKRPCRLDATSEFHKKLLIMVFFTSGAVSLTFQTAWERLLTLYYGVGPVSISLIVSIYMFGLGIGSLVGGHIADRTRRPIYWYVGTEIGLGIFALLSLPLLQFLGQNVAGHGLSLICISAFLSFPTLAMGMTLPLLVKAFSRSTNNFVESVGFLYYINTLGAACGALLSSYVLISFLGIDRTIYVGAAINFLLGLIIYLLCRKNVMDQDATQQHRSSYPAGELGRLAYLVVTVTGFVAIGFEIAWFRVLEVLVKASPYAFSSILAVYLAGIAFGSRWATRWLQKNPFCDRRNLFFMTQFLLGAIVLISFGGYYYLTKHTPLSALTNVSFSTEFHPAFSVPKDLEWSIARQIFCTLDIFLWPAFFILVPTILMGAGFPLISALASSGQDREGKILGNVYFFNTVGNVLGGVLTGFVILPALGTEATLLLLSLISLGMLLFVSGFQSWHFPVRWRLATTSMLFIAACLYFPGRGELFTVIHPKMSGTWEKHFQEGLDGVVMTFKKGDDVRNYINGLEHGSRPGYIFYRESVEAVAFTQRIKNVLIIGFGTGSIAEAIYKVPEIEKVTLVELNNTLLTNLRKMEPFQSLLTHPKLETIIDDGRRYLQLNPNQYDLVLIDPLRSTTAYSNNLYSQEFFELIKKRMTPTGVFMVWMDEYRIIPKTVASVFSNVRVYDCFCLASRSDLIEDALRRTDVLARFSPKDRQGTEARLITYCGDGAYANAMGQGFPVNQDWRPNCEYFIGLKVKQKLLGLH